MVRPDHYKVVYRINPYMHPDRPPDHALAMRQWTGLVDTLRAVDAQVEVIDGRADSPDMTFAMNLGMVVRPPGERPGLVVPSRMRHRERQAETASALAAFERLGFEPVELPAGCRFEAGDAFWLGRELVVAHGPRSDPAAAAALADVVGLPVVPVRLVRPELFHLDLALCPLPGNAALVCPAAFDADSAAALLARIDQPVLLDATEAAAFAANAVVVGRVVLMSGAAGAVAERVRTLGLPVLTVDVSQFELGGGSLRCLTNPLDVDLAAGA